MEDWYEAKKFYIQIFGGQPIYRTPEKIQIELTDYEKEAKFESFLDECDNESWFC